jgi:hypothetical protein
MAAPVLRNVVLTQRPWLAIYSALCGTALQTAVQPPASANLSTPARIVLEE